MDDINAGFGALASSGVPDQLISGTGILVSRKFTLLTGQVIQRGTVMGKITTGGKVVKSLSASADGSEVPDSIAAETRDATAGDIEILCYTSGRFNGTVAPGALTLGTAHTIASIREGLRDKGIFLDEKAVLA